ncbi:hypothetical protein KY330_03020 [Candidatus Woesearchaeota archaeon]|nr:hypothetical protein [Candidatus Woesearchaeota archaeon]
MSEISKEEIEKLVGKYQEKIKTKFDIPKETAISMKPVFSREYGQFKQDYLPKHLSLYEKLCQLSGKILKIPVSGKSAENLNEAISICHLNITPTGAVSFSYFVPLLVAVLGAFIGFVLPLAFGEQTFFFVFFFILAGLVLIFPFQRLPFMFANNWRMRASNQMVLCVFYIVTYMRHTSNLEHAINFAAEHMAPPLALDLKKVLWDVETEKFESIKESLDSYLETWRKWNLEFIEAIHLIESSLYEPSEARRLEMLDKSLSVMLDETYEKMLHYAHNLKSPITMLHMLGIILPILGLVILPLIVSFMKGARWYHIATFYNLVLPVVVYYGGKSILSKRPTGYGDTDISEENPELKKYKSVLVNIAGLEIRINPMIISILFILFFVILGFYPLLKGAVTDEKVLLAEQPMFSTIPAFKALGFKFLGYRVSQVDPSQIVGPFGLGSSLMSLFVVIGVGVGIGLYFRFRSKNVIKIREETKRLETEFASALFQLGNRLGDGLPAEMAFGKVADTMQGTVSGNFMELVSQNVRRLGMSVDAAIFDPKKGALVYFPSSVIESSMKVLTESVKKGPKIAAQALINISNYIKQIHAVNERLNDLMSDIISSMASQIKGLAPAIAGIVIGITSMVTNILGNLSEEIKAFTEGGGQTGYSIALGDSFGDGIPTFYFQIIVGIYVVQIVYILTILTNGISNGSDKLGERYNLGKNLVRSTIMYCAIGGTVMLLFNLLASTISKFIT